MASKVIISLPTAVSFQNVVKNNMERKQHETKRTASGAENVQNTTVATVIGSNNGISSCNTSRKDSLSTVDELEKTVKFLKDEQKRMLSNLHQEIASLQAKNRDLLCQLIFNSENGFDYRDLMKDVDIKHVLITNENTKEPIIKSATVENRRKNCSIHGSNDDSIDVEEIHELKYTIDQQQRETKYLKGQLEIILARNKSQNRESRQLDNYIHEIEDRNRDQEKVIRSLRKEIKDHKIEIENLRKTVSGMRMSGHVPHNVQVTHVQPQAQLFPAVGTPSTFWYQNRSIPISEYHQLQRTSISANGSDQSATRNGVQFTLPPVCNYRQIAVTAPLPPPPRFYSTATVAATATGCYYSVAPRPPMLRNKSYLSHVHSEAGHGQGSETIQQRSSNTNSGKSNV